MRNCRPTSRQTLQNVPSVTSSFTSGGGACKGNESGKNTSWPDAYFYSQLLGSLLREVCPVKEGIACGQSGPSTFEPGLPYIELTNPQVQLVHPVELTFDSSEGS